MAKKKKKVKKVEKEPEKEEIFYVGITDPIELKHTLLESSKDLIQYLERFENLERIRAEKKAQMGHLHAMLRDIAKDTRKLKTYLPRTKLRIHLQEELKKAKKKKTEAKTKKAAKPKKEKKPEKVPKEDMALERLEQELGAIESRLTKLT